MNIGNRIKQLRKLNKVNAKSLANDIGVSNVFLSYIENGSKKPSLDTLEKICSAFDITLADFFAPTDESEPLTDDLKELLHTAKDLTPEQIKAIKNLIKSFD